MELAELLWRALRRPETRRCLGTVRTIVLHRMGLLRPAGDPIDLYGTPIAAGHLVTLVGVLRPLLAAFSQRLHICTTFLRDESCLCRMADPRRPIIWRHGLGRCCR